MFAALGSDTGRYLRTSRIHLNFRTALCISTAVIVPLLRSPCPLSLHYTRTVARSNSLRLSTCLE